MRFIKAIILAGGEGTRLRPLTYTTPKPMAPLTGKPILEHIIALLARHGISDICITIRYLSEAIREYFSDGSKLGVRLSYNVEREPLGTAGAVRACTDFIGKDDVLVISGDAATTADLTQAVKFHSLRRAEATILLSKADNPRLYGSVFTNKDGRVVRFLEKPKDGASCSELVNTGIYVLSAQVPELIPAGRRCDFAQELFPSMIKSGRRVFAHEALGYWKDIGNCDAYLCANFDALSGKLPLLQHPAGSKRRIWVHSHIPKDVSIIEPCFIGSNVDMGKKAVIGPYVFIGDGSSVGRGAKIRNSVLISSSVKEASFVKDSLVCNNTCVPVKERITEISMPRTAITDASAAHAI